MLIPCSNKLFTMMYVYIKFQNFSGNKNFTYKLCNFLKNGLFK